VIAAGMNDFTPALENSERIGKRWRPHFRGRKRNVRKTVRARQPDVAMRGVEHTDRELIVTRDGVRAIGALVDAPLNQWRRKRHGG